MKLSYSFTRQLFLSVVTLSWLLAATVNAAKHPEAVLFSERFELTEAKAYQIQKAFVKNSLAKGAVELGYKAGLTNRSAQEKFAINVPISGVLLLPPAREGLVNPVFDLANSHQLMLELELAFKLNQN